ncbi:MAG TPA: hypothetical protein VH373_20300 [Jatrophihabitantaceae bacterium]|jgi:hypothetical protein
MTADFDWTLHPDAEALVDRIVADAMAKSPRFACFAAELGPRTSSRIQDWLDVVGGPVLADELRQVGYVEQSGLWRHPGAQLPAVLITEGYRIDVRVDDAAAFAHAQRSTQAVQGSPRSGYRRAVVLDENDVELGGVERRSWSAGIAPQQFSPVQAVNAAEAERLLAERPRALAGANGVEAQIPFARKAVGLVGPDLAAAYFLEIEREYWQRSNTAGTIQHARQDRLGLGWGNNDHHTFRSSRPAFNGLIRFLQALGFGLRERFYAGDEAGWGAQVLEHPGSGGVIFADVDLSPDEVELDFAQVQLAEGSSFGTVGMWCALHGESLLAAGMHHLEGQFDFDGLRYQLAERGLASMNPFSDFPHLRQAFTEAELWTVPRDRLTPLVAAGHLDPERADELATVGGAGSHLENLARRGGFKGFNQHNVSVTMKATHPRDYRPGQ